MRLLRVLFYFFEWLQNARLVAFVSLNAAVCESAFHVFLQSGFLKPFGLRFHPTPPHPSQPHCLLWRSELRFPQAG